MTPAMSGTSGPDGSFTLANIPPASSFYVSVVGGTNYMATRNDAIRVTDTSLQQNLYAVSKVDCQRQYVSLGLTPPTGQALLIGDLRKNNGTPYEGIKPTDITLVVTYRGGEGQRRAFDVLVDGVKVASESLAYHPAELMDREYARPLDLAAKVTRLNADGHLDFERHEQRAVNLEVLAGHSKTFQVTAHLTREGVVHVQTADPVDGYKRSAPASRPPEGCGRALDVGRIGNDARLMVCAAFLEQALAASR